jgi:hypothetical protein
MPDVTSLSLGSRGSSRTRGSIVAVLALACAVTSACDLGKFTVGQTAGVLARAQPSLRQESDYDLASRAIPGALKTIEGFWVVSPDNQDLINILTEGYCQYGTAFVEDDWEIAKFAKDEAQADYHNERATKIFTRCLNYALRTLGPRWQSEIFAEPEKITRLIHDTGRGQRTPLMWAAFALGSIVNHNLNKVEILAQLPTVRQMLARVLELDAEGRPHDETLAALPHLALGMLYSAGGAAVGGDPVKATAEFGEALKLTGDKYLLARTMWGFRVGKATNDRKLFHDQLVKVLETPPSVWPEQRLANEVAHRRARRYLSMEKELFQ